MKILVYSPVFLPHVGGLEISTRILCEEFSRAGHSVKLISLTPNPEPDDFAFEVVRCPSNTRFLGLVRWCDVFFQRNVSLRGLWPLLLVPRQWVVSHHGWYRLPDGRLDFRNRLKRFTLRFATASISISPAVADHLGTPSTVILNPYRKDLFRRLPGIERSRDLIFVGRLVSDKGVDLLVRALALLADRGLRPHLTIVGSGPELPSLQKLAADLGVEEQITFLGTRTGEDLVRLLNQHRILVVPSTYDEPFGNVALEGIACGCAVVGSRGGGLGEAIGPCGLTFENGNAAELTGRLQELLGDDHLREELQRPAPEHLARHAPATVARAYLEAIEVGRRARGG